MMRRWFEGLPHRMRMLDCGLSFQAQSLLGNLSHLRSAYSSRVRITNQSPNPVRCWFLHSSNQLPWTSLGQTIKQAAGQMVFSCCRCWWLGQGRADNQQDVPLVLDYGDFNKHEVQLLLTNTDARIWPKLMDTFKMTIPLSFILRR